MTAAAMTQPPATWAVYVHFPYCLHRCAYCDFATIAVRDVPREAYLASIVQEFTTRTRDLPAAPIASVFLGGGTPSLWGPRNISDLLEMLHRWGGLLPDAEITLEANPGTLESGDLRAYASAGIRRVSVGIQALDDGRLAALDRIHDAGAARRTLAEIADLLASGRLRSASADLLFGAPGQTMQDLQRDVDAVLGYGLPHLSAYSLTVEAGTPLAGQVARGLRKAPDDDLQSDMLDALPKMTAGHGLHRYEVSNFATEGHQCRHNLTYWTGGRYLALGVGAHGFLPPRQDAAAGVLGHRYGNTRSHAAWSAAVGKGRVCEEIQEDIDAETHVTERLMTGLRLAAGVDLAALRRDVGDQPCEALVLRAERAVRRGRPLELEADWLRLRPEGVRLLDAILTELA
jgi:oxygen-independent coproporphyrinogen-3 oxidase